MKPLSFALCCWLYRPLIWLVTLAALVRLFRQSLQDPQRRDGWVERISSTWPEAPEGAIWIHAASVGETMAALNLIRHLQANSNLPLVVTTTTVTAQQCLAEHAPNIPRRLIPYDTHLWMKSFVRRLRPRCLLVMETEIWPHMLLVCRQQHIPTAIVNARLSDKSLPRYNVIKGFLQPLLEGVPVLAQSKLDVERYKSLLGNHGALQLAGSLKTNLRPQPKTLESGRALRSRFSCQHLWVAGSTHEGEERIIMDALQSLRERGHDIALILVPRHPDRTAAIQNQIERQAKNQTTNLQVKRWSRLEPNRMAPDVLLVDKIGVLNTCYAAAEIAFVGGSLANIGGHNVLEPILYNCLTMTGPNTQNCQETIDDLLAHDAILQPADEEALITMMASLLDNPDQQLKLSEGAKRWRSSQRDAVASHMEWLANCTVLDIHERD